MIHGTNTLHVEDLCVLLCRYCPGYSELGGNTGTLCRLVCPKFSFLTGDPGTRQCALGLQNTVTLFSLQTHRMVGGVPTRTGQCWGAEHGEENAGLLGTRQDEDLLMGAKPGHCQN